MGSGTSRGRTVSINSFRLARLPVQRERVLRYIGLVWQLRDSTHWQDDRKFIPPLADLELFDLREFQNRHSPVAITTLDRSHVETSGKPDGLELLRRFTAVENPHPSEGLARFVLHLS